MTYRRIAMGLSIAVALILPCMASAKTTVSLCQTDVEGGPGTNLDKALNTGGEIDIVCIGATTIMITKPYTITKDTVIDGHDLITLKASPRAVSIFRIGANTHLTLRGLSFKGLGVPSTPGASSGDGVRLGRGRNGSVVHARHDRCSLDMEVVSVRDSYDPIVFDCTNSEGLNISSSEFINNKGTAISSSGQGSFIKVRYATFRANDTGIDVSHGASARVDTVTFSKHKSHAISVSFAGNLDVRYSKFIENTTSKSGAGIYLSDPESVYLRTLQFEKNRADKKGGAIAHEPFVISGTHPEVIRRVLAEKLARLKSNIRMEFLTFIDNSSGRGGAIDAEFSRLSTSLAMSNARFTKNLAHNGAGGAYLSGGMIQIASSLFQDNSSTQDAGALMLVSHSSALQGATISNSLIVANTSDSQGSAIRLLRGHGGSKGGLNVSIRNTTIMKNRGVGISGEFDSGGGSPAQIALGNTIIANNQGDNCRVEARFLEATSSSIQFPAATCGVASVADPQLDGFYAPLPASPAIGSGDLSVCTNAPVNSRDFYHNLRGAGGVCTVGAVERFPEKIATALLRKRYKAPTEPSD